MSITKQTIIAGPVKIEEMKEAHQDHKSNNLLNEIKKVSIHFNNVSNEDLVCRSADEYFILFSYRKQNMDKIEKLARKKLNKLHHPFISNK